VKADTQPSLWTRARDGEAAARDELGRLALEVAERELRVRGAAAGELEDLVQETLRSTLAYLGAADAEEPRDLRAFLKYRAWGVLSDSRKRRRLRAMETLTEEDPDLQAELPAVWSGIALEDLSRALQECTQRLPETLRAVVAARYDGERSSQESASRLGLNTSTYNVRVFRALAALKECLGRKGFAGGDAS
jgi:RNA polymerase sigma factor (sigma-70 family)